MGAMLSKIGLTHAGKSMSLRTVIPKKVVDNLGLQNEDVLTWHMDKDKVCFKKLSV